MTGRATIQRAARRAVKEAAATYDRLLPPAPGIVVLAYHRVGRETRVSVDLPEWLFEEQMVRLSEGPGIVGLDEALFLLAAPSPGAIETGRSPHSDDSHAPHNGEPHSDDSYTSHDGDSHAPHASHDDDSHASHDGDSHAPHASHDDDSHGRDSPSRRPPAGRSHGHDSHSGDSSGLPARRHPVVVSFDDGTADFVEVTVPILVRHGIPAILYLATAFIEEARPFPDEGRPASWAGLREALSTGLVQIGSHSHTHLLFDRASATSAADDLDRSIGLIGDRLGVEARHFAYPKALRASGAVEAEVRSRFASAAVAGTAPNRFGATDPHCLSRSPVQVHDGLRFFELKARGGLRLEDSVRRLASRRRYAGAAT